MDVYGDNAKAEFASEESAKAPGLDVDASKTFEVLKYEPKVDFEEGIKKVIIN